jgi:hypothetical protein
MSETPEQKELRIVTAVGQSAVKVFVERLREWCGAVEEESLQKNKDRPAWKLLEVADKLIEQMDKENE